MTDIVDRKIRTTLYEIRDVVRSSSSILILAKTYRSAEHEDRPSFRRFVMVDIVPFMQAYAAEIDFPDNIGFHRAGTVPKIRHGTST